jgi:hypothetical protein
MSDELEPSPDLPDEAVELRAHYRRLQPPPLADDLEGSDPETARVVQWMQGAWRGLTPPRTLVPGRTLPRPTVRLVPRLRIAAAAAAVLLAGAALWRVLSRTDPTSAPAHLAQAPAEPLRGVEVIDVRPDRLELRSGPVRLLLLDPPPESPDEPPRG